MENLRPEADEESAVNQHLQSLVDVIHPDEAWHTDQTLRAVAPRSRATHQPVEFSRFAHEIAHDLNNLLLTIIGFTDLVLDEVVEGSLARANLQHTLQASRQAKVLVQRLINFDRATAKELRLTALHTVIEEMLPVLRTMFPSHIGLSVAELAPGMILADQAQLQQVLMNLCSNAVHAIGQAQGLIEIAVQCVEERGEVKDHACRGSSLCLSVRDTGCGMSEQLTQRIFCPFFTTKPAGQGNGLGLSIVDRIVQAHGGTLSVDSTPGKGTTFQIYFPLIEKEIV